MRKGTVFLGTLLVILGILLLLYNLGLFGDINIWGIIGPLLLIVVGAWIIWGIFSRQSTETEHVEIPLEGARRAHLHVKHGAGKLTIFSGTGLDNFLEGDFGGGLEFLTKKEGDLLDVNLQMPSHFFPSLLSGSSLDWSFGLNQEVPLTLNVESGANDSQIDLSELQVTELKLKSGASSTNMQLPSNAGYTRVDIESGAASVRIKIPEGVSARVHTQSGLSDINVDRSRFPGTGGVYQSLDYESALNRVDIYVQMGVGSLRVS